MEREPIYTNPGELTGQAQNTYPNSMDSGSGPELQNVTGSSVQEASQNYITHLRRIYQQGSPQERENARLALSIFGLNPDGSVRESEDQQPSNQREGQQGEERQQRSGQNRRDRGQEDSAQVSQKPNFNPDAYTDPAIKAIASKLDFAKDRLYEDPKLVDVYEEQIKRYEHGSTEQEARDLLQNLELIRSISGEKSRRADEASESTFSLYLTRKDFDELRADPMMWLKHQINKIYSFSSEGQEQSSPLVQGAQQLHERALSWLSNTEYARRNPEMLTKFAEEFTNRLYTMFARSAVQQRNMEGISGIAAQLGTHGIMNTLSFENGLVNRMHNRINELYDDTRLTLAEQHITPVEHQKIQRRVMDEYARLILASKDKDLYREIGLDMDLKVGEGISRERQETVALENIRRAVRTAYDHFVASQREAVIVARGNALPTSVDLQGILADPSGLFQMFNLEQLLIAKFGTLNHEQQLFFNAIKRRYAESKLRKDLKKKGQNFDDWAQERIKIDPHIKEHEDEHAKHNHSAPNYTRAALEDYGSELVRDLMQVNDWYSSGWKLDEFMKQYNENMQYRILRARNEGLDIDDPRRIKSIKHLSPQDIQRARAKASEFGLFMRLRVLQNGSYYNDLAPHEWKHMKSEDKDKFKDEERIKIWNQIAKYKPEDVVRMFREHGDHHGHELQEVNQAFVEAGITLTGSDQTRGLTYYDKFKEEYGPALRIIRELGYSTRVFDERENKWVEDWNKMPEQIDFSQIASNPKYAQILNNMTGNENAAQTIATLFGKLQKFAGNEATINKLMKDPRFNQANLRTFTVDDGLLDRMEQEDLEVGLTALSKKLSPESGGDAYKRTFNDATAAAETHKQFMTFLTVESEEEKMKAALAAAANVKAYRDPGVAALVFRHTFGAYKLMGAITEKDQGAIRTWYELLDWQRKPNKGPINELQEIFGPEAPSFNNDSMLVFLDHHHSDFVGGSEELWEEMKEMSRTKTSDRARFQFYRFLLFAMLWIFYEGYNATKTTVGEGLKSEDV